MLFVWSDKPITASGKLCFYDVPPYANKGPTKWDINSHIALNDGSDHFECSKRNGCVIEDVLSVKTKLTFPYIKLLGAKEIPNPEIPRHPCDINHVYENRLGTWEYITPQPISQPSHNLFKILIVVIIVVLISLELKIHKINFNENISESN